MSQTITPGKTDNWFAVIQAHLARTAAHSINSGEQGKNVFLAIDGVKSATPQSDDKTGGFPCYAFWYQVSYAGVDMGSPSQGHPTGQNLYCILQNNAAAVDVLNNLKSAKFAKVTLLYTDSEDTKSTITLDKGEKTKTAGVLIVQYRMISLNSTKQPSVLLVAFNWAKSTLEISQKQAEVDLTLPPSK